MPPETQVLELPIAKVKPNPANAREQLRDIDTLAASIEKVGLIEPLIVKRHPGTGAEIYMVLAGHRRLAAIADNTAVQELTASELAAAVGQLDGLEMSDEEIAQALDVVVDDVADARTLHRAPKKARDTVAKVEQPSLEQAAAIARFADDEDALQELLETIEFSPNQLTHTIAQLDAHAERDRRIKELEEALDPERKAPLNRYGTLDERASTVEHLRDGGGKKITEKAHETCPGHSWTIMTRWRDRDQVVDVQWCCSDWAKHGHTHEWYGSTPRTSRPAAVERTEAEREKTSKDRREVIANNKAWGPATKVRLEFVKGYLARKDLPATVKDWIAAELVEDERAIKPAGGRPSSSSAPLVWVGLLGQLFAWRPGHYRPLLARYLRLLESLGYALSDVEKLVLKGTKK